MKEFEPYENENKLKNSLQARQRRKTRNKWRNGAHRVNTPKIPDSYIQNKHLNVQTCSRSTYMPTILRVVGDGALQFAQGTQGR